MKLFVANPTKQQINFTYRLPDSRSAKMVPIAMGQQMQIGGDLTQAELDYVIEQNQKYGLVAVADMSKSAGVTMIYSIDKPVPVGKLHEAIAGHTNMLEDRGRQIRQEAAVAVNNTLKDSVGPLRTLEMSAVEEEPRGGFVDDSKQFSERLVVASTEKEAARAAETSQRRRRA